MMNNKNSKLLRIVWLIVFLLLNGIAAAITFGIGFSEFGATYFISLGFAEAALIATLITMIIFAKSQRVLRDWFFGFPIIRHCVLYVSTTLTGAVLFMLFHAQVIWWIPLCVFLILLAAYILFAISCMITKNAINELSERVKEKTDYISLLRVEAEMLSRYCTDAAAKKIFDDFAEDVRFSDPMSNESLFELEKEIQLKTTEASYALRDGRVSDALTLCRQAKLLLADRNMRCRALK